MKPFAPAHARSERVAGGRRFSWIRRIRQGGDGGESEAPLAETQERYRVSIISGAPGAPALRVAEVNGPFSGDPYGRPHLFYSDAQIAIDFLGGAPLTAYFEVAQISDSVRAGLAARGAL